MFQYQEIAKYILLLLLFFILGSCGGDSVCYEADDFGFTNFTVSSRYSSDEMSDQDGEEQVAPWRNSNYRVNGRPLVILVKGWKQGVDANIPSELSAWCPWYSRARDSKKLSDFCERLRECTFVDDIMCTDTPDAQITNAPCIFTKGVGLYALIAEKESDPNASFQIQKNPQGVTFHLGERTVGYKMSDLDSTGKKREAGGIIYKYEDDESLKSRYADSELYFKILDKFYDDNSGRYKIAIKSGITTDNPDPITTITNLIKTYLFGTDGDDYGLIRNLYTGIINNDGYRVAVSALLSFYILWSALSYLSGNIEITHTELLIRILKIAVISVLLSSEYSWSFFYDYLFVWFVGGVEQLLQMIMEAGATGPGSPGILAMMLAPQTMAKLFSLLFIDWMGFLYIILFFFALYFIVLIFFDAAVIYLTALMAVGMIITMGPVFICFLLFGITRSLFENWLRQLTSYAIQPIILFTGIVFISMILRQEIYGSLGFQVCKRGIFQSNNQVLSSEARERVGFDIGNTLFYWWFPKPMRGEKFSRTTENIPIPIDHFTSENNIITGQEAGTFCEAYGCMGERYVDLPFLDPEKDQRRIRQFWNGKFVQMDGLLLIFVAIYLLNKFNTTALSIARFISGSSGNLTDIRNVSGGVGSGIHRGINNLGKAAKNRLAKTKIGRKAIQMKEAASSKLNAIKNAPSQWIDNKRIARLKAEATSKPNSVIAAEVKKNTGLDYRDVKEGAIPNYKRALASNLRAIDPTLTDKQLNKIAEAMSGKKFKELENEFAKAKYGKKFAALSDKEKASIKNIISGKYQEKSLDQLAKKKYGKGYKKLSVSQRKLIEKLAKSENNKKSLQELAIDAEYARKYAESYVDAYQALSERGVGLFGKRVSIIRSLEEINHKAKIKEEMKKAKKKKFGEELYAEYENLKHSAFEKVAGKSDNRLVKAIGNSFAGGAWNNIDMNPESGNYRMQTYNEQLADRDRENAYYQVSEEIDRLSKAKGESITSPEFLAKARLNHDVNLEKYQDLAKRQLERKVYQELSAGDEPVIRGQKFMKEYAKDSEMMQMIDKAQEIKLRMLDDDPTLAKEGQYQLLLQKSKDNIIEQRKKLEEYYGREIANKDLVEMLGKYNKDQYIDEAQTRQEKELLENSLRSFVNTGQMLKEINQRKMDIAKEVDKHIMNINNYRKNSGMKQY